MKLAILGTGLIVKQLVEVYDQLGIEKTYLLGTPHTEEETKQIATEHHFDGYDLNYEDILKRDIDTVYVAVPNFLHYSFVKKALEAGKHVIVEKPSFVTYKELEEMAELAEKNHVILVEAMNVHDLPAFLSIKEDVKKLGDIKIVIFNYTQYSSRYDAFQQGNLLPVFDPKKAGGALMDLNVYNIHAIVDLFGKPNAVRYIANIERDIDTSGILTYEYDTFKAVSIGAKDCKAPVACTIQGDKGYIRITTPVNFMTSYEVYDNAGNGEVKEFVNEYRLLAEFREFIKMIDGRDYERAREKMEISKICLQIIEEARKQEGIKFCDEI